MVMTTCWFPKQPTVTTGPDLAEMDDVPSSTKEQHAVAKTHACIRPIATKNDAL